ncbi:ribonuclease T2 [Pseudooceanicola sp. HF7]|uniref:ribonuclease T2 family protein n=1 Tax=Pseudooceanicola sp. HF7 TaxID=2721560 RepID=UPI001431E640|nr:ribonuclease T2 [Pseudooceanicola sp. HF7]NIZ11499.1 ribonuclease T2 [Pseudooceanicola sp. HF7]
MRNALVSLILLLLPLSALGQGRAGDFDYYLLSLSWSPGFCEEAGPDHAQCGPEKHFGWILHGLWPQYEEGYPRNCPAEVRDASRAQTAAMADIMGTDSLAWHEWKAHGRCSGLEAEEYFQVSRRAYEMFALPDPEGEDPLRLSTRVLRQAILQANDLGPDQMVLRCEDGWLRELRICLTKTLEPRDCGADIRGSCGGAAVLRD